MASKLFVAYLFSLPPGLVLENSPWCFPSQASLADNEYVGGKVPKELAEQCHLNVIDARNTSAEEFAKNCHHTPCLIRNTVDARWQKAWTLKNLIREYGHIDVKTQALSDMPGKLRRLAKFFKRHVLGQKSLTQLHAGVPNIWDGLDPYSGLGRQLRQRMGYRSHKVDPDVESELESHHLNVKWQFRFNKEWQAYQASLGRHPLKDRTIPDVIVDYFKPTGSRFTAEAFVAGGPCSGSYAHTHGPSVATLAHGMKRWAFALPGTDLGSYMQEGVAAGPPVGYYNITSDLPPHLRFFHDNVPEKIQQPTKLVNGTSPVFLCTQHAGDSVFIPASWWHVTVNMWPSLAAVTELDLPDTPGRTLMQTRLDELAGTLEGRCDLEQDVTTLFRKYEAAYDHGVSVPHPSRELYE